MSEPLKLHLRVIDVPGYTYRVVALRSSFGVRISNNRFHDTWHLLSDASGAATISRLLWGLSFQRRPGTLVWIGPDHLVPTPFEADPPTPCIFAPTGLTSLDRGLLRALRDRLRRPGDPTATVRWSTFSMDAAAEPPSWELEPLWKRERMERSEGFICYSAPPEVLRVRALEIEELRRTMVYGTSHVALATDREDWRSEGEVQIFADFGDRVASARMAREQVLPHPNAGIGALGERWSIWKNADALLEARVRARRKGARGLPTPATSAGSA
jgi:hypothetical protein